MSCQICGRRSAPGARLCSDCYAARKRAYDATITQPLVMAGRAARTPSRLHRSDNSPEAKARRAAKKAQAAIPLMAATPAPPSAPPASAGSRSALWTLLSIGVVLAAIAGWYLPSRTAVQPDATSTLRVTVAAPEQTAGTAADLQATRTKPPETAPVPPAIAPLPAMVERDLAASSAADAKPAPPKRTAVAPRPIVPTIETPPAVEIVRMPPRPAAAPPRPKPIPRADRWQDMKQAIGRCPEDGFLARVVCEQRIRLQYCEGHWGQVPQCPGGPSIDHG